MIAPPLQARSPEFKPQSQPKKKKKKTEPVIHTGPSHQLGFVYLSQTSYYLLCFYRNMKENEQRI
jgi:hypothetical protein